MASEPDTIEIVLAVRSSLLRSWERLFVVGSEKELGDWNAEKAKEMERSPTDRNTWKSIIRVSSRLPIVSYRYFIGYYLDSSSQCSISPPPSPCGPPSPSSPQLLIHRFECSHHPRTIHPNLLQYKNGRALREAEDTFGMIDGRTVINDGWLLHDNQSSFFIRIHGKALKFFQKKNENRLYRVKVVPFDVRFRETVVDDADADRLSTSSDLSDLPEFPSFSNTELSVLTRDDPIFGQQYDDGSIFRNSIDYLVFRTHTVSIENLGFRIELYSDRKDDGKSTRVGVSYALPSSLNDTCGKITLPIISCDTQRPIGQINIDYMLASSLKTPLVVFRDSIHHSYARHWKKRRTLEVGHRGCGSSYTKSASSRENTLHSLQEAGRKGADMVEFDVHLTKDKKCVVYHDFHVVIEVQPRPGSAERITNESMHEVAIKDLKLSQLHRLHFEHTSAIQHREASKNALKVTPGADDTNLDHSPFPPLETVLNSVDPHVGFNIEVKFPMLMKGGDHECRGYFERNEFCDVILNEVLAKACDRRIVFSSFDPDICTLLSQKQHRFPVLFLVVGATARYEPFEDIRSDCSRLAVNYAAGSRLLGVNFHSEELLKDRTPFDRARQFNLVTFVWGDDLNERSVQDFFKKELGVDGLIYDRIGEEETRKNIFLVEREARAALFNARSPGASPMGSRRSSLEDLTSRMSSLSTPPMKPLAKSASPPSSASSTDSNSIYSSCLNSIPPRPHRDDSSSPRPPKLYVRSTTMHSTQ